MCTIEPVQHIVLKLRSKQKKAERIVQYLISSAGQTKSCISSSMNGAVLDTGLLRIVSPCQ